jgi:hypothetical protein
MEIIIFLPRIVQNPQLCRQNVEFLNVKAGCTHGLGLMFIIQNGLV